MASVLEMRDRELRGEERFASAHPCLRPGWKSTWACASQSFCSSPCGGSHTLVRLRIPWGGLLEVQISSFSQQRSPLRF